MEKPIGPDEPKAERTLIDLANEAMASASAARTSVEELRAQAKTTQEKLNEELLQQPSPQILFILRAQLQTLLSEAAKWEQIAVAFEGQADVYKSKEKIMRN